MSNTVEDDGVQGQNMLDRISSLLNGGPSSVSPSVTGATKTSLVLEDVSQTRTVHEEEILLINGIPVRLPAESSEHGSTNRDGTDDDAISIRDALRAGEIPSIAVLNRIIEKLHKTNACAGIVAAVETSLTVTNCRKTTEKCVVQPVASGTDVGPFADPWEVTEERMEKQLYSSRTVEMTEGYRANRALPSQKHYWPSGSVDSGQWTETDVHESKDHAESTTYAKADDLLLHYTEGNLISGSLDGLLTHFTPTVSYIPDRSFIFTFLLASRQFMRPDEILEKIMKSALANGGIANMPHLLAAWMNDFPYDFRDEHMMRLVRSFTEQQTSSSSLSESDRKGASRERCTLSRALRRLANRLAKLEKYEVEKNALQHLKYDADEWRTAPSLVELASGSPVLMANTLTAIEAERFSFIGLEEFFPASYSSGSGSSSSSSSGSCCRAGGSNLLAYVQWYNRLTYVVATDILRSPRKRHRARAVEFWIETGRECFNRGNFNSLMAIIATLTGGPIGRLKKTWTKVTSSSSSLLSGMTSSSMISSASGIGNSSSSCSSAAGGGRQQLAILEHQADPTNNFATYRATLQAAAWRSCPSSSRSSSTSSSKSSQQNSSCSSDDGQGSTSTRKGSAVAVLPFFSLLLKDLHFLNETSGSSILANGHINFDKWRQLGERLLEVRRWQRQSSLQRRCRLGRRHKSTSTVEATALRDAIERGPTIGGKESAGSVDSSKAGSGRDQVDSSGGADDGERGAAALSKVSYEREAAEGAVEKAHWKTLQQYHA
ncbi:ras-GEF domain-containing family member 1B-like isoform X2 [Anopheles ziemanni]|uniref:ras-GEF domain-containing family member 1B-like isoform X2 n=1 Tax=Anopheles coustani TaxID=139045 RepID=UPI00265AF586|nr:ras-GEF domain-containing family member 1B-like isoform X2 [Anopheles coustani]XP_058176461.1 ras-GEF domain-containing family member 1B-like isoform X2 [Anopheles ziemanni]